MIGGGNTLGRFMARLGMDESDYTRGIINAAGMSRVFGDTFATFVSNPLLGSINIMKNVGGWLVRNSQETLAYAETIERLSQQTGASERLLISLQKRLEIAGFSSERAGQGMAFFNKFIEDYNRGGKLTNDLVAQLGVNLDELEGTDARFAAIVDAISRLPDPATRSAIAMQIFGRMGGPELINAIGGGSEAIDEMIDQYTRLGFVIDRDANTQLAALNTNLGFLEQSIEGIKTNFLNEFLIGVATNAESSNESVVELSATINAELTPAARQLGSALGELVSNLREIGEFADDARKIGDVANFLFGPGISKFFLFDDLLNVKESVPQFFEGAGGIANKSFSYALDEMGP